MNAGDLIYDHDLESFGIVLQMKELQNYACTFEWAKVLYPWGVDEIEVQKDDLDIEVIRESR